MVSDAEKEALRMVLRIAEQYGYGNCIALLRRAWMDKLVTHYGLSKGTALLATDVEPYSERTFEVMIGGKK